jgi:gas vesicle protein
MGVLAAQALPQVRDAIDDLTKDLEDLNKEATELQQKSVDDLSKALSDIDESTQQLLHDLEEDLQRNAGILEQEIHDLEDRAREERVDISECIGDHVEQINDLPTKYLADAGVCFNLAHGQAEAAVNDGVQSIIEAVGPIEEFWRQLERCQEADREEQEICIAALHSEIINDQVLIPTKIHLIVQEVTGHLEDERVAILECSSGKPEALNEDGRHIVDEVTQCAEHIFPRN